jgi:hypothetical protein
MQHLGSRCDFIFFVQRAARAKSRETRWPAAHIVGALPSFCANTIAPTPIAMHVSGKGQHEPSLQGPAGKICGGKRWANPWNNRAQLPVRL